MKDGSSQWYGDESIGRTSSDGMEGRTYQVQYAVVGADEVEQRRVEK